MTFDGSYNLDVYRKETPEAPHSPVAASNELKSLTEDGRGLKSPSSPAV